MPWSIAFMVVAIILVVTLGRVAREKHRATARIGTQPADHAELRALRDETHRLKERIQVLERVITDERKSLDLDREIERLRDR